MNLRLLPRDNISKLLLKLAEEGSVFYPETTGDKGHLVKFEPDKELNPDFVKIRTAENIKHFLFPSRDMVARFPQDASRRPPENRYLVGVKACDLRGVDVYDRVFIKWEPADPRYHEQRKKTVIIAADCPQPEASCFCNLVGVNPYAESTCDISFTPLLNGLLFDVLTEKGEAVVAKAEDLFRTAGKDEEEERETIRKKAVRQLQEINNKHLKDRLGYFVGQADKKAVHAARDDCVECFACLHACPTCYCFLLADHKRGKEIERIRFWDACYYAAYARVAGGANPRGKMDERFWNRFNCKFNYFHQYEGLLACSGCGRCYLGCSAKIDIREILLHL